MGALMGKEKPLKEVLRENKRMITRAIRELDRERAALEREEKKLTIDIFCQRVVNYRHQYFTRKYIFLLFKG